LLLPGHRALHRAWARDLRPGHAGRTQARARFRTDRHLVGPLAVARGIPDGRGTLSRARARRRGRVHCGRGTAPAIPAGARNVIPWLRPEHPPEAFPPVEEALQEPNGLLCVGGDLSVERLLEAY